DALCVPRRFERGICLFVRASGDVGRGRREAAADSVEVCRAGKGGVQKEGEQKDGRAPRARAARCPSLSLDSQPLNFPLGEACLVKFNHTGGRAVKLVETRPARAAPPARTRKEPRAGAGRKETLKESFRHVEVARTGVDSPGFTPIECSTVALSAAGLAGTEEHP
ncbi:MAG: hypothetical protein LC800_04960, partial [Acidobacteria bacterium]|nr:hypothetical protein [Acidobacteriota bacterium]